MAEPLHVCSCGRTYTRATWLELPFCGIHDDGVERLEMRNCPCGSTRSVPVEEGALWTSGNHPQVVGAPAGRGAVPDGATAPTLAKATHRCPEPGEPGADAEGRCPICDVHRCVGCGHWCSPQSLYCPECATGRRPFAGRR